MIHSGSQGRLYGEGNLGDGSVALRLKGKLYRTSIGPTCWAKFWAE